MLKMAVDEGLVGTLGVADPGDESARLGYQWILGGSVLSDGRC